MSDKVTEIEYRAAHAANEKIAGKIGGPSLLGNDLGSVVLDQLEENAKVKEESVRDSLTGLLNRRGWNERTLEYLRHAARTKEAISFVSIDLDDLKKVNDSGGHKAGDALLQKFANVLTRVGRSTDVLARVGGDEFAVCLSATSLENAEIFKERVQKEAGSIGLSIGVGKDYTTADTEMYKMKAIHKHV